MDTCVYHEIPSLTHNLRIAKHRGIIERYVAYTSMYDTHAKIVQHVS